MTRSRSCRLWPSEMGLVATSSYKLSNHISIFRRFHLSYKAQKERRLLLSREDLSRRSPLFYFCLTFRVLENWREMDACTRSRRIPAVFFIKSAECGACADKMPLLTVTSLTQRSNVCACASVCVAKRLPKLRCGLVGRSCDTQIASQELKTTTQASKSVHILLLRHTVATCRSDVKQYIKLKQEKMRGQRGRLRALAGICYVHESYF